MLVASLIGSFTYDIRLVTVGIILSTFRQIVPLYDLEQRKNIMPAQEWQLLTLVQFLLITLNMILISNIMDRGFALLGLLSLSVSIAGYY